MTNSMIGAELPHASFIVIYTAASWNPKPAFGGSAAILHRYDHGKRVGKLELTGGDTGTDNIRLEMEAVVAALRQINKHRMLPIIIRTNSDMFLKAMTEWLPDWVANGWRKRGGEPVKNADLWQEIIGLCEALNVTFESANSGDPIKRLVAALAVKAREEHRSKAMTIMFGTVA